MTVIWSVVSGVFLILAAFLLAPTLSDLLSALRVLVGGGKEASGAARTDEPNPRLLILVPAHDEELLIAETVRSILAMRYPEERRRTVVIADNCSDRTAEIAREAGAECIERTNTERRGKPHALDWAIRTLGLDQIDAVVVIDADTVVDPGFAEALANRAPLAPKAVQASNGVANPDDNAVTRMSAVFAKARYEFAFPLKERARLNVPLQGTGMVIGAEVLERFGWRAFSICEDWELYAIYTELGVTIELAGDARLFAQEARSLAQSKSQRERWTAGKMTVLLRHAGPLLRSRAVSLHQKLDALGELVAPGPAVHLGSVVLASGIVLLLPLPGKLWVVGALLVGLGRLSLYTLFAIARTPRPIRALTSFLGLPFYTVWRLGVQLLSLRMIGDKPWVRTGRHEASGSPSD